MQLLHQSTFRPSTLLVIAIALMATLACGTAAEPNTTEAPTTAPTISGSTGHDSTTEHNDGGSSAAGIQSPTSTDGVVINLPIVNRDTTLTRDDLRVSQGDTVRLVFEADEEGEIHLHGYDLTAEVSPGHPGELVFEATNAGAFGLNFHVFAAAETGDADDHHGDTAPALVASETPVSVAIAAEPDAQGGVDVFIATDGFRFAPELVDQAHTPGAGHAHIYLDGVKLGRVFEKQYHIADVAPGAHEIRVSLNTNDHGDLTFNGEKVEHTVSVTVPDVGQSGETGQAAHSHDGHGHSHGSPGEREIIAEVHLGNLEVYP